MGRMAHYLVNKEHRSAFYLWQRYAFKLRIETREHRNPTCSVKLKVLESPQMKLLSSTLKDFLSWNTKVFQFQTVFKMKYICVYMWCKNTDLEVPLAKHVERRIWDMWGLQELPEQLLVCFLLAKIYHRLGACLSVLKVFTKLKDKSSCLPDSHWVMEVAWRHLWIWRVIVNLGYQLNYTWNQLKPKQPGATVKDFSWFDHLSREDSH